MITIDPHLQRKAIYEVYAHLSQTSNVSQVTLSSKTVYEIKSTNPVALTANVG